MLLLMQPNRKKILKTEGMFWENGRCGVVAILTAFASKEPT